MISTFFTHCFSMESFWEKLGEWQSPLTACIGTDRNEEMYQALVSNDLSAIRKLSQLRSVNFYMRCGCASVTPIGYAIWCGDLALAHCLLECGADTGMVQYAEGKPISTLMLAINIQSEISYNLVTLLVENSLNPHYLINTPFDMSGPFDKNGNKSRPLYYFPLDLALETGQQAIVAYLHTKGAGNVVMEIDQAPNVLKRTREDDEDYNFQKRFKPDN